MTLRTPEQLNTQGDRVLRQPELSGFLTNKYNFKVLLGYNLSTFVSVWQVVLFSFFCFVLFCFVFDTGFLCIALAVLELTL